MTPMKKRTAILALVCATIVIIGAVAGVSKWNAQRKAQQEQAQQTEQLPETQQEIDAYRDSLQAPFDSLLDLETNAAERMAEQRAAGVSDREILSDFLTSIGDSIQQLADAEAPENLSDAHQHFVNAADSYADAADDLNELLDSGDLDSLNAKLKLAKLAPTALDALDEVKAGIQALEDNSVAVPESAKQLEESLDGLVETAIDQVMPSD